jgi:hypothetical protein
VARRVELAVILVVGLAVILILAGTAWDYPGLAVLILVVATPILIRLATDLRQRRAPDRPARGLDSLGCAGMVGLVFAVLLSAVISFVAVCFPLGLAGFNAASESGPRGTVGNVLFIAAWPLALLIAVLVALGVARAFLRGRG